MVKGKKELSVKAERVGRGFGEESFISRLRQPQNVTPRGEIQLKFGVTWGGGEGKKLDTLVRT